jgi:TPR repeat protein
MTWKKSFYGRKYIAIRTLLGLLQGIALILSISGCVSVGGVKDEASLDELKLKASAGDAESQYQLGVRYTSGTGVTQDYTTAGKWLRMAAQQDHPDAQYLWGIALNTGRGVDEDQEEAVSWFTKAALAGKARARYQLGEAFVNGRGVTKDVAWGARWLGLAAYQGHIEAQFSLGILYTGGLGVPADTVQAVIWLDRARNQGHPSAGKVLQKVMSEMSPVNLDKALSRAGGDYRRTLHGYINRPTVRFIQFRLKQKGYATGYPDGIRGPRTDRAAGKFLADQGKSSGWDGKVLVSLLRN